MLLSFDGQLVIWQDLSTTSHLAHEPTVGSFGLLGGQDEDGYPSALSPPMGCHQHSAVSKASGLSHRNKVLLVGGSDYRLPGKGSRVIPCSSM